MFLPGWNFLDYVICQVLRGLLEIDTFMCKNKQDIVLRR